MIRWEENCLIAASPLSLHLATRYLLPHLVVIPSQFPDCCSTLALFFLLFFKTSASFYTATVPEAFTEIYGSRPRNTVP